MKKKLFNITRTIVLSLVTIIHILVFTPFVIVTTPVFFTKVAVKFIRYQGIKIGDMGFFTELLETTDKNIRNLFFGK